MVFGAGCTSARSGNSRLGAALSSSPGSTRPPARHTHGQRDQGPIGKRENSSAQQRLAVLPCQHQAGRTARTHWLRCEEPLDVILGERYSLDCQLSMANHDPALRVDGHNITENFIEYVAFDDRGRENVCRGRCRNRTRARCG